MFKRRTREETSFVKPELVGKAGREAANPDNQIHFSPTVIYDEKSQGYSIAVGTLADGKRACAIRWNGDYGDEPGGGSEKTGTPAHATPQVGLEARWFVLPEFLWKPTIDATYEHLKMETKAWLDG